MIISTRESQRQRERVLNLGVLSVKRRFTYQCRRYAEEEPEEENSAQFDLNDTRTLDQIVNWLLDGGFILVLYSMLP